MGWRSSKLVRRKGAKVRLPLACSCLLITVALTLGCGEAVPVGAERYASSDTLFVQMEANLASSETLSKVAEIDHSRMGAKAGSTMPPARVLIYSDPALETELINQNPLVALDLPLRVLAYEPGPQAPANLIYNNADYLSSRYDIALTPGQKAHYEDSIATIVKGIATEQVAAFSDNTMQPDGIITIPSPYDFTSTLARVQAAIDAQDDTVHFGSVDFQSRANGLDKAIAPTTLILFGAPAPGAKAMAHAPTLGLDAFCQKMLVWQDEDQRVYLSFNDLLALAERQGVTKSIALRVIHYRLNKTFTDALAD